jgi:hypothetical protein
MISFTNASNLSPGVSLRSSTDITFDGLDGVGTSSTSTSVIQQYFRSTDREQRSNVARYLQHNESEVFETISFVINSKSAEAEDLATTLLARIGLPVLSFFGRLRFGIYSQMWTAAVSEMLLQSLVTAETIDINTRRSFLNAVVRSGDMTLRYIAGDALESLEQ